MFPDCSSLNVALVARSCGRQSVDLAPCCRRPSVPEAQFHLGRLLSAQSWTVGNIWVGGVAGRIGLEAEAGVMAITATDPCLCNLSSAIPFSF